MPAGAMSIARMGTGFIGGQIQGWARLLDKWAMEDAYKDEIARQSGYRQQAQNVFNKQLTGAGAAGAQKQMGQAYTDRLKMYGDINEIPLGFDTKFQRSASPGRDAAYANLTAQQRAALMKYGDWLFNQKLANMSTGRSLDQITNFAGGTARVFPYLMYDAQHSNDALEGLGAAISAAGGALGSIQSPQGGGSAPPPPSIPPSFNNSGGGYGFNLSDPNMAGYLDSQRRFYTSPGWTNPNWGGSLLPG